VKRLAVVLLALIVRGRRRRGHPDHRSAAAGVSGAATGRRHGTVTFRIVSVQAIDPGRLRHAAEPRGLRVDGEDGHHAHYVFGTSYTFDFRQLRTAAAHPRRRARVHLRAGRLAHERRPESCTSRRRTDLREVVVRPERYMSAIDREERKLLWRSPALVANAANFVLLNDTIVSGYGFTPSPTTSTRSTGDRQGARAACSSRARRDHCPPRRTSHV
jgi:hypothetical protein